MTKRPTLASQRRQITALRATVKRLRLELRALKGWIRRSVV